MEVKDIISSGLLELHALGLTSSAETEQIITWVSSFPELSTEMEEIERTLEAYAWLYAIEPSQSVRQRILHNTSVPVLKKNDEASQAGRVISISPFWKYAAVASIVLLLGSAILNFIYYGKYKAANTAYEQKQNELTAVNDRMKLMDDDMSVVKNKYSQPVSLNGLPAAPDAAAKIFWMKNTGDVYIDPSNLPDAPKGMQYQVWAIVDGKPVDAGMIITTSKENKYHIQKMKAVGNVNVQAFAVTLETAGGNPAPKGEMYVMGEM